MFETKDFTKPAAVVLAAVLLNSGLNADGVEPALKEAYKDFVIGAALNPDQFEGRNTNAVKLIEEQFNSISPENVLKWALVHPKPDQYDFKAADRYVGFGVKNQMFIVGHTLVWHSQTPRWVFEGEDGKPADRETLLGRMHDHISTVVGRYKGKIRGWDVVNEALNEDGSLRKSKWMQIIGEDYLLKAYQFAREADPNLELYYNDFSLENEPKRNGAVALIKKLQSGGVKIAAVGLQGHYKMDWPKPEALDGTIRAFANLGVKVSITELDIDILPSSSDQQSADVDLRFDMKKGMDPYKTGLPESKQDALAKRYGELFAAIVKNRDVIERVTFWGVADGDSWLNDWPVRGRTAYPLLFDRRCQAKPAFMAVIAAAPGNGSQ